MRRPSQDARLPPWAIQLFGMAIATAMAVFAIVTESIEIGLACITFAGGCVGLSVFGRATGEVEKVMAPPPAEDDRPRS